MTAGSFTTLLPALLLHIEFILKCQIRVNFVIITPGIDEAWAKTVTITLSLTALPPVTYHTPDKSIPHSCSLYGNEKRFPRYKTGKTASETQVT